jgi:tetratricopeptide (TPR) repeat protein
LNQHGIHYVQHNQLGKAEHKFKEAIQADSSFGPAYNNLGLVFFHQHDFFEAARAFESAHERWPESPEPLNNLGLLMETVARPDEALAYYQEASELDPICAEYLGNMLRARIRMELIDEETLSQLHRLLLIEKRTEWQDWAREQLALFNNPNLDRGPAQPSSDPLGELSNSNSSAPFSSGSSRSSSSAPDAKSTSPEEILTLPPGIPKELPDLEPLHLPSPLVPSPSASPLPSPQPAVPSSMLPSTIPQSSRRQKSILEVLE